MSLEVIAITERMGTFHEGLREAGAEGIEAAIALGDLDGAEELLADLTSRTNKREYLRMHLDRLRARLAAARGDTEAAAAAFPPAVARLREFGAPFWLAVGLFEYGEWLAGQGRTGESEPLLTEASEIFELLKARPWLERLDSLGPGRTARQPVASGNT